MNGHVVEDELAKGSEGIDRSKVNAVCFLSKWREKRFQCPVVLLRSKVRTGNVLWGHHQSP